MFQWQHNAYTYRAVIAALDNGFNGVKSRLNYPSRPFGREEEVKPYLEDAESEEAGKEYTSEEMKKVNLLFASLDAMKVNWDLEHKKADSV